MCQNPTTFIKTLRDGSRGSYIAACGNCWECRKQYVDDYVGRILCEVAANDWARVLTLTYRDSAARELDQAHLRIHPPHFQKWVRSLRDASPGSLYRFFTVAEYGSQTGRAHFHSILMGNGEAPDWRIDPRNGVSTEAWPHGGVKVDPEVTEASIRYTVKYLLKAEEGRYWCSMSKRPALGSAFFRELGEYHARMGVPPVAFDYVPPGSSSSRRFLMNRSARRIYLCSMARALNEWPMDFCARSPDVVRQVARDVEDWMIARSPTGFPVDVAASFAWESLRIRQGLDSGAFAALSE